jgi:hypothetical protein
MAPYVIELPHTNANCLRALDEMTGKGLSCCPGTLGLQVGVHNGWAIIDADSESAFEN